MSKERNLQRQQKQHDGRKQCSFIFQMPLLESFIYVSTSFSQCGESVLEERAYPPNISPESIMCMVNTMTDEALEVMKLKLLGDQPNTYAYSKALSEDLVSRSGLPVGVIRPSIGENILFLKMFLILARNGYRR